MSKGTLQCLTILGRLGCDPKIKEIKKCLVARLNIATTDMIKKKGSDDLQEETTWHRVTMFRQKAEFCRDYLKKGDTVIIEAKLRNAKWQDKDGKERQSIDIIGHAIQQAGGNSQKNSSEKSNDPLDDIE